MQLLTRSLLSAIILTAALSSQATADRLRILEIPLEMPLENELDGQYLEGIYQEKLGEQVTDSVLNETPVAHIETKLTDNRRLDLWFSSIEDGNRIFWIQYGESYHDKPVETAKLLENFQSSYGAADVTIGQTGEGFSPTILIKVDPNLPADQQSKIRDQLLASFKPDSSQLADFWHLDIRQRARLLGSDFRGAILTFVDAEGKAHSMTAELIDLSLAKSVFNLDPQTPR